jgi:hypothetical protein
LKTLNLLKTELVNMNINLKEHFLTEEEGTTYHLPTYDVVDGQGIVETDELLPIRFVRGSKLADEEVERRRGTLHEHLLAMMIHDLRYKSKLVPSRESSIVITKLEEALHWLRARQIDRVKREVVGTYKP